MGPSREAWDVVVIGSGFGGSVAALRLVQKGYRVAVLERGRRIGSEDFRAARKQLSRLFWSPRFGWQGFFEQRVLRHVGVVAGVGVGGGSLVYGAVHLEPRPGFFRRGPWTAFEGLDWEQTLRPHYAEATRLLGRHPSPYLGPQDHALRATARSLGAEDTFKPITLGIDFERCTMCGGCMMVGCPYGAKRSLDRTYLAQAEALGARIFPSTEALNIRPVGGEYRVATRDTRLRKAGLEFRARRVVCAAGVLGTVELLLKCRDVERTLPKISTMLGRLVRTNSEALMPLLARDPEVDLTYGPGISSHFYPDAHTHITNNRFSAGQGLLRAQVAPHVDEPDAARRALRTLYAMARHPLRATRALRARNWHKRLTILTVMQDLDNHLSLALKKRASGGHRLASVASVRPPPSHIPVAHAAAQAFAEHADSEPLSLTYDALAGIAPTAHILGGAVLAPDPQRGVVDGYGEVFGYPGLSVTDASIMPCNVGVNPALSITALAEHCLSSIPPAE